MVKLVLYLSRKFLFGQHRFGMSLANILALLGIFIGVVSVVIVTAGMNGFDYDITQRVVGTKGDIKISGTGYRPLGEYKQVEAKLKSIPGILSVSPIVTCELMMQKGNNVGSAICFGVDYYKHAKVTNLLDYLRLGSLVSALKDSNSVVIGAGTSIDLGVTVGEVITLVSPIPDIPTPLGLLPKSRDFTVRGIFFSGMPEYDRSYCYFSLDNARYFKGYGDQTDFLEVKTQDPFTSEKMVAVINKQLGKGYLTESWSSFDSHLFSAIKTEKFILFTLLLMMVILSVFNLSGNFAKMVTEKKVDLGVLKALGLNDRIIALSIITANLSISFAAVLMGLIVSLCFVSSQIQYKWIKIPVEGFMLPYLPMQIRLFDIIMLLVSIIVLVILSTIYPLKKMLKINPVRILRNLSE